MTATTPRRLRRALWALAAAVCLGAAVAGWWAWDRSHVHNAAVPGDVLVDSGGRTLTTPVTWTGCEDRPRLVVHETDHAVTLLLERRRHAFLPNNTVCDGGDDALLTAALRRPIGSRKITDALTGAMITPFSGSHLLRPSHLPEGYAPAPIPLLTDVTRPPYKRTETPVWDSSYRRDADKGGAGGVIGIIQTTGRTVETQGSPVSINGHPGRLEDGPTLAVTWFDGTYTISVLAQDSLLTTSDLLKVAEHLQHS